MKLTFTNNTLPIGEIKITKEFSSTMPRLAKLKKCMDFYRTNGYFDRQIIVDSDKTLHDGYCAYITAVLIGVHKVKVLVVSDKPFNVNVKFTGSMEQLGRALKPVICKSVDSKPEPVKLYCVKDYRGNLTRGKIYEVKDGFMRYDDGSKAFMQWMDIAEDIKESWLFKDGYLVPLVRRPAKVGEWVYIDNAHINDNSHIYGDVHNGAIFKVSFAGTGSRPVRVNYNTWLWEDEYLVLDGFKGDRNCN